MIEDYNAGWVCKNLNERIRDKLIHILMNKDELKEVRENLKSGKYVNDIALLQFKNLLGDKYEKDNKNCIYLYI